MSAKGTVSSARSRLWMNFYLGLLRLFAWSDGSFPLTPPSPQGRGRTIGRFIAFATALRGFWAAIGFGLALASQAAVTPYPVGPSGVTNSFDALPTLASGWTTMNWGSANTAITNTTQMDTAARTNNAANIVTAVSTDSTMTNSMTSVPNNPAGTTCFRWNSPGHFVASRPTSIAYGALLGTFVNSSGTNRQVVAVGFDYYLGLPT